MSDQQLLQEILDRVKEASEQANTNAKCLAVLSERVNHHCNVEHKEFDILLEAVRQGKATAKVLSIIIAGIVAVSSAVAWIIDHIPKVH